MRGVLLFKTLHMQKFLFNTGVKPWNCSFPLGEHEEMINNEKHIAFYCEGVPDGATLDSLCDNPQLPGYEKYHVAKVLGGGMASKYAYFKVPKKPAK